MTFDIQRIRHITGDTDHASRILVIGLGSGGFPVMQHLAMSGWHRFSLVDPDVLDEVNLVKHPGNRSDIGKLKVEIARDWLLDRNPACTVDTYPYDVTKIDTGSLFAMLEEAAVVVAATDSNSTRHFINDQCLAARRPMTLGLVHRGGLGGTVLVVRPGRSGCYACMELVAEGLEMLPQNTDLEITDDETEMLYGRNLTGYSAAGLSADIAFVTAVHAQVTVAELLRAEESAGSTIRPTDSGWLAIRMRVGPSFAWRVDQLELPPIDGCVSCSELAWS